MDKHLNDPNSISPSGKSKPILSRIKFSFTGTLSAVIRTIIDLNKPIPQLGAGTLPEWIKAISFSGDIEREAHVLLVKSIIRACREQLRPRIDDINENKDDGTFVYLEREIRSIGGEIEAGINDNEYTLDLRHFDNPRSFSLLEDFKPFYKSWIMDSFPISESHADDLTTDFPDYFAYAFQVELGHGNGYTEILKVYHNPFNEKVALMLARKQYRMQLKELYNNPALGEPNIALSDVYIEPSFLVYDAILPEEKRKEIRAKNESGTDHFLSTPFQGSIHDYISKHFLKTKQSKAIGAQVEESRMLILMGQPGHGKSSFCYRSIYDLQKDPDFHGNAFLVRLQEAERSILNTPLAGMAETDSIKKYNIRFRELIENNNGQTNIVFLDGLDEFFMTKSLSDSDVLLFLNNLKTLLRKNEQLYFLITSRFNYVETSKLYNEDCLLFSLGVLDEQQQCDLVQKYANRIGETEPSNLSPELLEKINKEQDLKHIKELVELPILLQMILISNIAIEKTGSRATIYDTLFTTVLDRKWDKDKRLKKYWAGGKFKKEHLRAYISFLAFKIFQYNKGYLNKSEIEEFDETRRFVSKRLRVENEDGNLKEVLKDILTSFYLKESIKPASDRKRGDESYDYAIEFLHKSLYEYLACEYLWNATQKFFLAPEPEDPDECKDYSLEAVQRKIQELFSCTSMTRETMLYMREIVRRDTSFHESLSKRMAHYLPRLLKYGFIYEYKASTNNRGLPFFRAEKQALNAFHNYWLILGNLNQHRVDLTDLIDSEWAVLKKNELFLQKKTEMIEVFKEELELAKRNPFTIATNNIVVETALETFRNSLETSQGLENTHSEQWVRGFLIRIKGALVFKALYEQLSKEKEAFIQQLQLVGASGMPMNLSLSYAPLKKGDLSFIRGNGINLSSADLSSADLYSVNLISANLISANLISANLISANLINANLINANLISANLNSANLDSANLNSANLSSANLYNANLYNANLNSANLNSANLNSANLYNANLYNANLYNANLNNANLYNTNLYNANLYNANLYNTNLSNADLSNADLSNANLRNAILHNANLRNANLHNAILHNVKLKGAGVDIPDWINQLKTWKVDGLDWVSKHYVVSKEKRIIEGSFEAYEILSREKENEE